MKESRTHLLGASLTALLVALSGCFSQDDGRGHDPGHGVTSGPDASGGPNAGDPGTGDQWVEVLNTTFDFALDGVPAGTDIGIAKASAEMRATAVYWIECPVAADTEPADQQGPRVEVRDPGGDVAFEFEPGTTQITCVPQAMGRMEIADTEETFPVTPGAWTVVPEGKGERVHLDLVLAVH